MPNPGKRPGPPPLPAAIATRFTQAFDEQWAAYERKMAIYRQYQALADAAWAKKDAYTKPPPAAERHAAQALKEANDTLARSLSVWGRTGLANGSPEVPRDPLREHLSKRPIVLRPVGDPPGVPADQPGPAWGDLPATFLETEKRG